MLRGMPALFAALLAANGLFSQNPSAAPDSLGQRLAAVEKEVGLLKNLKLTGYVQAQWVKAEAPGARILGGGGLAPNADNKFTIRRGRLRFQYSNKHFMVVAQPDFTERSIVLRDFFGTVTDPWTGAFSLTVGQFFRPVSYEITYPSWQRESPDRARFSQMLYADERDIGAKLTFNKKGWKIDLAMLNGNAMAAESDSRKDFAGRVGYSTSIGRSQFAVAASTYRGHVRQSTNKNYEQVDGGRAGLVLMDTLTSMGRYAKRQYLGFDLQFSRDWRPGKTTFRMEIAGGLQPGTAASSESQKTAAGLTGAVYTRQARGGAAYLVQNIGHSPWQAVVKYDFFDGNERARGDDIGTSQLNLGAADLRYDTWGVGLIFNWENLQLMAYHDFVRNETSANLPGYGRDLDDDFWTFRAMVRF